MFTSPDQDTSLTCSNSLLWDLEVLRTEGVPLRSSMLPAVGLLTPWEGGGCTARELLLGCDSGRQRSEEMSGGPSVNNR